MSVMGSADPLTTEGLVEYIEFLGERLASWQPSPERFDETYDNAVKALAQAALAEAHHELFLRKRHAVED